MLPYRDSRLTQIALVVFFVVVIIYAYYESRGLLFGPKINLPTESQEVHEPFIRIKGKADRISSLSLNGKQIPVTEQGEFDEPYLLSPGLNRILLDATDKYGRSRQSVMQVVYTPADEPIAPTATTTVETNVTATSTATTTAQ